MNSGRSVRRWTRVRSRYSSPNRVRSAADNDAIIARKSGNSPSSTRACNRPAIIIMSGSSIVPSTWLWLDNICSTSVEPERGNPTMKIGSGAGQPPSPIVARNGAVKVAVAAAISALKSSASCAIIARRRRLPRS